MVVISRVSSPPSRLNESVVRSASLKVGTEGPVKRGAEHQTESHSAAGDDTQKGDPVSVGSNNSVRSAA